MSIFGTILSKIFGSHTAAAATPAAAPAPGTPAAPAAAAAPAPAAAPAQPGDGDAVLGALAAKNPEKLNWQTSIVDLMKLLDMDSSLSARKELATELHYTGDMNDSASMNVWLIKQVMAKLAANGGKVSPDLMK